MDPEMLARARAAKAAFDALPDGEKIVVLERRLEAARKREGRPLPDHIVERWRERLRALRRAQRLPEPVQVISVGLCYASLCTTLSPEDAAAWLNANHPTGIRSPWKPSADNWFHGGQPNPCPCNRHPDTHQHMLFDC